MKTPDYCEGCNQRFAPIDQQSCWGCTDGDCNTSKRGQQMTETMEKRLEQMDSGVIALCQTISQVKKTLCGNEKATNEELLQAVSQVKFRLAQVEKELNFKEKCLEWRYRDIAKAEYMIDLFDAKLAQAERERDAAVSDLVRSKYCPVCVHHTKDGNEEPCKHCINNTSKLEWRGICPENTKEESM